MYRLRFLPLLFLFLFSSSVLYAQQKALKQMMKQAEFSFAQQDYHDAAMRFEAIAEFAPDNAKAAYMLAESYRRYFEYDKAEQWYLKTLDLDQLEEFPLAQYWAGNMLKSNGKYEQAKNQLEEFIHTNKYLDELEPALMDNAILVYNGCILATTQAEHTPKKVYMFENLGVNVNSSSQDFAPALFGSDSAIVLSSSREGSTGHQSFARFGEHFSDNYRFQVSEGKWEAIDNKEDNFNTLNTARNDGAGVLSYDGRKYYYTICDEQTNGECAIYVSYFEKGTWKEPIKLNPNINPEGIWNAQPAISTTGDTLYFTSKREGGYGENDIWYSVRDNNLGEEGWSEAINLGDTINTPHNDMAPNYHHETGGLFFASDGHEGYGGLDIFYVKNLKSEVYNIGEPFNSSRDDFHFALGKNKGYLSSNRIDEKGVGKDDIYSFNYFSYETVLLELPRDDRFLVSTIRLGVTDPEGRPQEGVKIIVEGPDGVTELEAHTGTNGTVNLPNIPRNGPRVIKIPDDTTRITDKPKTKINFIREEDYTEQIAKTLFENIYFDFDQNDLRAEAKQTLDLLLEFHEAHPDVIVELHAFTDSLGTHEYNDDLAHLRGEAAREYLVKHGFASEMLLIDAKGENSPLALNRNDIGRQLNRRVEFFVVGHKKPESNFMTYVTSKRMSVRRISKMFQMTEEDLINANDLSAKRVGAFKPLRVKKDDPNNMVAAITLKESEMHPYEIYMGENWAQKGKVTQVVKALDRHYETMLQIQNQFNLRDNHKVMAGVNEQIYVVKPLDTLSKLANRFNTSVDEIKTLNKLKTNRLQIGQRLRIRNRRKKKSKEI